MMQGEARRGTTLVGCCLWLKEFMEGTCVWFSRWQALETYRACGALHVNVVSKSQAKKSVSNSLGGEESRIVCGQSRSRGHTGRANLKAAIWAPFSVPNPKEIPPHGWLAKEGKGAGVAKTEQPASQYLVSVHACFPLSLLFWGGFFFQGGRLASVPGDISGLLSWPTSLSSDVSILSSLGVSLGGTLMPWGMGKVFSP